jgi:hypothetical protein
MRRFLTRHGWRLIAGEFPGGSDHELYPLNVVDPAIARDESPDPRRHSLGELIPDLIALQDRKLFVGEAKVRYDEGDRAKLVLLLSGRKAHLLAALRTFARERQIPELLPVERLVLHPVLVFRTDAAAPRPTGGFSYLRVASMTEAFFEGPLSGSQP